MPTSLMPRNTAVQQPLCSKSAIARRENKFESHSTNFLFLPHAVSRLETGKELFAHAHKRRYHKRKSL